MFRYIEVKSICVWLLICLCSLVQYRNQHPLRWRFRIQVSRKAGSSEAAYELSRKIMQTGKTPVVNICDTSALTACSSLVLLCMCLTCVSASCGTQPHVSQQELGPSQDYPGQTYASHKLWKDSECLALVALVFTVAKEEV